MLKYSHPLFLLSLLLTSPISYAEEASSSTYETPPNLWQRTFDSLESFRDSSSNSYQQLSQSIDQYFAETGSKKIANKSHVRLEIKTTFFKSGEREEDIKLRAKLDLPGAKKRFKLVFDSSPDEERSLEERVTNDAVGERVRQDDSVAGLEFTPSYKSKTWKRKFTGGVKLNKSFNPYAKYIIKRNWASPNQWKTHFKQTLWYYDEDGFGESSKIIINKSLTSKTTVEVSSELEFLDDGNIFYYSILPSLNKTLSPTSSIQYYTGAIGSSQPTNQVTSYVLGVNYRKQAYKDWLFFYVEPGLSLPRSEGWKAQPSLTLRLKIYFTGQK